MRWTHRYRRVTAGYVNEEPRREFFRHMDAANIDLKAFSSRFYRELCAGDLDNVLETLIYLKNETDVWFEITTLLIPGENDSDEELNALSKWVVDNLGPDVPVHFSAFHPDWRMRDKQPTEPTAISHAREIALHNGIRHVFTGNVHNERGASTYCHECGSRLIGRDWYVLTEWNLTGAGDCAGCGARCPGIFDDRPGDWGAKRMPIRMRDFHKPNNSE